MKARLLGSTFFGLALLLLSAVLTRGAWGPGGEALKAAAVPKPLGPALISAIQQNASKHYNLVDAGSTYLAPNRRGSLSDHRRSIADDRDEVDGE